MFGFRRRKMKRELEKCKSENIDLQSEAVILRAELKQEKEQVAIYVKAYDSKAEELKKYKADNLTLIGRMTALDSGLAESRQEAINRLGELNNANSTISALYQRLEQAAKPKKAKKKKKK